MMKQIYDVAVLTGSLRRASYSRAVAQALADLAPAALKLERVEIGHLPHYNQDLDETPPEVYTAFRARIRSADAVLFVTPEYNRSVPGVLKNAVDVGSRPYQENAWRRKPAGVVSLSTGPLGGFGANHHLRQTLVCLNLPTMPNPELYLGGVDTCFDGAGRLIDDRMRVRLNGFMEAFARWVALHAEVESP